MFLMPQALTFALLNIISQVIRLILNVNELFSVVETGIAVEVSDDDDNRSYSERDKYVSEWVFDRHDYRTISHDGSVRSTSTENVTSDDLRSEYYDECSDEESCGNLCLTV